MATPHKSSRRPRSAGNRQDEKTEADNLFGVSAKPVIKAEHVAAGLLSEAFSLKNEVC
jgi:hypothetical protein